MFTQESISKVLREINAKVPKLLRERAVNEVKKTPTMEFMAQKFLEEGHGTDKEREQIKALLDTGEFSKTKLREDSAVTKQIDQFISREIKKAIKQGRLPKDATPYTKEIYEKLHN